MRRNLDMANICGLIRWVVVIMLQNACRVKIMDNGLLSARGIMVDDVNNLVAEAELCQLGICVANGAKPDPKGLSQEMCESTETMRTRKGLREGDRDEIERSPTWRMIWALGQVRCMPSINSI